MQAARLASEILVKWHDRTTIADDRLIGFLIADIHESSYPPHFFGVWRRLDSLGRENIQHAVSENGKWTEFQCAILQILCAKYDIEWAPDNGIVEQWKQLSTGERNERYIRNRIRQAALYLTPSTSCNSEQTGFPRRTRQLFLTEGHLRNARDSEKFRWICSWFPDFPK